LLANGPRQPAGSHADAQIVLDGHVDERAAAFGYDGEPCLRDAVRLHAAENDVFLAVHDAGVNGRQTDDGPHQGRLARAVGAEHCEDLATRDFEADAAQSANCAVAHLQLVDGEHVLAHLASVARTHHSAPR